MPHKELTRQCICCGKDFTFPYKGEGRPRRYCDTCVKLPPRLRDRNCPTCGEVLAPKQTYCERCSPVKATCAKCNKPLTILKDRYCSIECMPPRPTCKLDGCDKPVHRPEALRQWPRYCSEKHRNAAFEARHSQRRARQNGMLAFWSMWHNNQRPARNPLFCEDLPVSPRARHPQPIFTESANTGLTTEDLHQNIIERIMEWTHVLNFMQNPDWEPQIERPDQITWGFMWTYYLHITNNWRIMPWLWDEMTMETRYWIRQIWKDYTRDGNTLNDSLYQLRRAERNQIMGNVLDGAPKRLSKQEQAEIDEIDRELTPKMPFAGVRSFTNYQKAMNGDNKTETLKYTERCAEILQTAARGYTAAPPNPRSKKVREVSRPASRKATRSRS